MSTRLLLIDPDIAFVVSIKTALEKTGDFQVSISANGAAAEDALSRHRHDVAVIAFDVTDMDALELIVALRHVQGDLPVIMTPESEDQQERIRFMDVQGAIKKPYAARDLIPYLRSVLTRARNRSTPKNEFVPPEMPAAIRKLMNPADSPSPTELLDRVEREKLSKDLDHTLDVLEEFEAVENSRTRLLPDLDQQGFTPGSTVILSDEAASAGDTDVLEWSEADPTKRLESTRALPEEPAAYDQWQPADPNQPLQDPDTLDQLIAQHGWINKARETKPLAPDFPNGPPPELDALSDSDFGEVLDSLSGTSAQDRQRSPDARAFHDMVDAMRPEPRKGRNRLEDLLASIAADAAQEGEPDAEPPADNPLDYVLDAIRRGKSLSSTPNTTSELGDATIGDVIGGLFDPSFEGVLAALAGEEISEETYVEPSYTGERAQSEGVEPRADDQVELEEMVSEEGPQWLREYEGPPATLPEQHGPILEEPPINAEDSSHYPATAALSAVTGDDLFSLDDLLVQIEQQLPPTRSGKPQLKPLPSWEREIERKAADQLANLFDGFEGIAPETAPLSEAELTADTQPIAVQAPEPELELEQEVESELALELDFPEQMDEQDQIADELSLMFETDLQTDTVGDSGEDAPGDYDISEDELAARLGSRDDRPARVPETEFEEDELAARLGVRGDVSPEHEGYVLSLADLLSMADLPVEAAPQEYEQELYAEDEEYAAEEYEAE
ncbi:MAG TPA: response regulator, partial [Aggregatilineaceae bacterium]|nr:response regulator [Aggregatilineaceae bacterium]